MEKQLTSLKKCLAAILLIPCFIFSKCNKEDALDEYYFRCKIDGEPYIPNGCANCMSAQILDDTVFIVNGNAGFMSIAIGINDKARIGVKAYTLNEVIGRQGSYDISPQVDDIFLTDSARTGQLDITSLDRSNRIVSGTFHFKGYNPVRDKIVNITEGKFHLEYITN